MPIPSLKVQAAPFGRSRHLLSHVKSDQTQIVQAADSVLLLGHWVAKASGRIIHRITTISRAGQSTMNRSIIQVSLQEIESISHLKNKKMIDSNKVPIGKRIFFLVLLEGISLKRRINNLMIKLDIHAYTELTFRLDPLDVFFRMVIDAIAVIYFELFRSESLANSHIP